ncbi:hypothetical protein [Plantactinospora sp. WMMB782]|uniref:hypothetical protein n=1 Tax=Plantactinospora sp. WMMB782 TaxID=3404121 RepID=UPI003B93CD5A
MIARQSISQPSIYLAGPPTDGAALDALTAAGCHVVTAPAYREPDTLADLLDDSRASVAALLSADMVVTLPGAETFWEAVTAGHLGLPVVALGDALAVVGAA